MKKIAIIGTGQLGSRHLQSLARLKEIMQIFLVDPSEEALRIALERYKEVSIDNRTADNISLLTQVNKLPSEIDLVIVACNSFQRRKAIEELFVVSKCKYLILEKFLFPELQDYDSITELLKSNNAKAWVNCPRRMYTDYQNIKNDLSNISEINVQVSASQLALASNAIHYIDLFNFLGATSITTVITENLQKKIVESKRKGYTEFYGTLNVFASNGTLSISSFENSDLPLTISIITPDKKIIIQEAKHPYITVFDKTNNWEGTKRSFTAQYQSELTHLAVEDIFKNNTCSLTSYDESAHSHKLLLNSYLKFYNTLTGKNNKSCPVT